MSRASVDSRHLRAQDTSEKFMNCRAFVGTLADYVDGDLPAEILADCEEHLARCPNCSAYLQSYQATIRAAQSTRRAGPLDTRDAMSRLLTRVLTGVDPDKFTLEHGANGLFFG